MKVIGKPRRRVDGRAKVTGHTRSRGRISVLDRAALERSACECYGIVRDAYREFGGETALLLSASAG